MDKRMAVRDMLSNLSKKDFVIFGEELVHRKGKPQVTTNMVEGKSFGQITNVLISTFNETGAVEVAAEVMKGMKFITEADQLLADTGVKCSEPGSSNNPREELSKRNVPAERSVPEDQWRLFRTQFIKRVTLPVLNDLLDILVESLVINDSEMQSARTKSRNEGAQEGAREVVDMVQKKGPAASRVLIDAFRDLDPYLYKQLNLI